jgi:hypothetical protein
MLRRRSAHGSITTGSRRWMDDMVSRVFFIGLVGAPGTSKQSSTNAGYNLNIPCHPPRPRTA